MERKSIGSLAGHIQAMAGIDQAIAPSPYIATGGRPMDEDDGLEDRIKAKMAGLCQASLGVAVDKQLELEKIWFEADPLSDATWAMIRFSFNGDPHVVKLAIPNTDIVFKTISVDSFLRLIGVTLKEVFYQVEKALK
jgi:hypothetical protein